MIANARLLILVLIAAAAACWMDPATLNLGVLALGLTAGIISPGGIRKCPAITQSQYQTLFNSPGQAILIARLEPDNTLGPIIEANDAACEYSGYGRDELVGMNPLQLSCETTNISDWHERLLKTGHVASEEIGVARDGRHIPVEVAVHLVEHQGEPAVLFICRDLTKRREVEAALRQSTERFHCIFDQAPVGMALTDADGALVLVNHAFITMLGYDPDQMIGMKLHELTCPEDRAVQEAQRGRLGRGEIDSCNQELRLIRKDGGLIWARVTCSTIKDSHDRLAYVVVIENVSQEKAAKAALVAEHEAVELERRRLRAVLDILPVGVFIAGADGRIIEINPSAQAIWGSPDVLASRPEDFTAWCPETGRPLTKDDWGISRVLRTGESLEGQEIEIQGVDGARKRILAYALPIRDHGGRIIGAAAVNVDISLRRAVMEQLRELNETLEQRVVERTAVAEQRATQLRALAFELTRAEQRERRRIAQMLHDHHQQLLVAAKLSLSMLNRRVSRTELHPIFQRISELLDQSIDGLRSLTVELSPTILHDAGLSAALEWLARNTLAKYNLNVTLDIDPDAEPVSEEISIFLFQASRELLFNTIKHAQVATANITMRMEDDDNVRVTVSDTGAGFDPKSVTGRGGKGGFGLFSLRERLELIGGRAVIESAPGQGTSISMIVPRVSIHDKTVAEVVAVVKPELRVQVEGNGGRTRVLLVDDHEILREGMAALLHEYPDFEVIGEASDGILAIEMARHTRPDVIIMDVAMPRLDGIEATRRIKAMNPEIEIIGLSMYGEESMVDTMRSAGASAYLPKGCPADLLISTIRRCVARETA